MAVLSRSGYGYPRPGALCGLIAKLSHRQSLGKRVVGEVTSRRDSSARHGRCRRSCGPPDTIVPACARLLLPITDAITSVFEAEEEGLRMLAREFEID